MRALIQIEMPLGEPTVDFGFVTWFDILLLDDISDDGLESAELGKARAARVHVGQILNANESLYDVLDVDSGDLEALHSVFFGEDGVRDPFRQGGGTDLLYIDHVSLEPGRDDWNLDLAVVRRLCDTLGEGCEIAVIQVASDTKAAHWERMGFQRADATKGRRFLYLPLAFQQARVVAAPDRAGFKVVPNPPDGNTPRH
jgi:hypothetical protein